jgi:LysR family transcriptional regulator, transcriptional activator of nhaA
MKGNDMAQLNYKHLRYFWMVAKTGSIVSASEQLFLSPQSISGQLGELELSLGVQLFQKKGRGLEPTEMGRRLLTYADEIFTLGDELLNEVHQQTVKKSTPFRIGISDTVAKSVAYQVIAPVLKLDDTFRLFCNEGKLAGLLAELSVNQLDLVIADRPMPANLNVRAYNHLLGESKLAIFASPTLIAKYGKNGFPAMLNNAPYLMAGEDFAYKKRLIAWFEAKQIYPNIVAEFDDSALLKYFGQAGAGFFAAPSTIADYICKQYDVEKVGDIETVLDELYVITTERRLTHPAIVTIVEATAKIFA